MKHQIKESKNKNKKVARWPLKTRAEWPFKTRRLNGLFSRTDGFRPKIVSFSHFSLFSFFKKKTLIQENPTVQS
jgi:hypothetical protein